MKESTYAHAVEGAIKYLSVGGIVFLSWTVLFGIALTSDNAQFLEKHWSLFYRTWIGSGVVWVVWFFLTAKYFFGKSKEEETLLPMPDVYPTIAPTSAESDASVEPTP